MSRHMTFYYSGDRFDRRSALYHTVKARIDKGEHLHVIGRKIGRLFYNCDCTEAKR